MKICTTENINVEITDVKPHGIINVTQRSNSHEKPLKAFDILKVLLIARCFIKISAIVLEQILQTLDLSQILLLFHKVILHLLVLVTLFFYEVYTIALR
ncbi:hypothetical protein [Circoviridae sp.]|nr:hypothetical protein [Circoviridae sp.]UOF78988.1 hypothetical protein [Cressdnaviricota sp.]